MVGRSLQGAPPRRARQEPRFWLSRLTTHDSRLTTGPPLRIIQGKLAGRRLTSPADQRVRPTAEKVRDAWLTLLDEEIQGARILDLFAGTGALGLEAISRGAVYADFVEFRPASLHALRANVAALRLRERARIYKKDAVPFTEALDEGRYDLAFADPPYGSKVLDRIIATWRARRFSRILTVEHAKEHAIPGGSLRKVFGDVAVTVYR